MKTLFSPLTINEGTIHDAVIEHYSIAERDENGNILYTIPEDFIAKCKQRVYNVVLYVQNTPIDATRIVISGNSIKKLYEKMKEIESLETEEFCEP